MKENRKDSLYIPQGIKTRREYFEGFGKEELIYMVISIAISSAIAFVLYYCFSVSLLKVMMIVLFVPTFVVFMSVKMDINISVWEEIQLLVKFQKSQKYYPYIALNEWEK